MESYDMTIVASMVLRSPYKKGELHLTRSPFSSIESICVEVTDSDGNRQELGYVSFSNLRSAVIAFEASVTPGAVARLMT